MKKARFLDFLQSDIAKPFHLKRSGITLEAPKELRIIPLEA